MIHLFSVRILHCGNTVETVRPVPSKNQQILSFQPKVGVLSSYLPKVRHADGSGVKRSEKSPPLRVTRLNEDYL